MDLPPYLRELIVAGRAVLMLGRGASLHATGADRRRLPTDTELANIIANQYLGGDFRNSPLSQVCELAENEADLVSVQEFIRKHFEPFEPTTAHRALCDFSWYGVATINVDRLVEKAYDLSACPRQRIVPFIDNDDRINVKLRDPASLPLLKLNGCITRTMNSECPLALTVNQRLAQPRGRLYVTQHFAGWARDMPIVFLEDDLDEPLFRALFIELDTLAPLRPRSYLITPKPNERIVRLWEKRKLQVIDGTFSSFMDYIRTFAFGPFQGLQTRFAANQHPIVEHFASPDVMLSRACHNFLTTDVEYVKSAKAEEVIEPKDFYKGYNPGWSAIEQDLDVRRSLADSVLSDYLLEPAELQAGPEFVVIKGHAGAGKSIVLRRIAWDAARDYGRLCLYLLDHGVLTSAAAQELVEHCNERLFIFVDDVQYRSREIEAFFRGIAEQRVPVTVIAAAAFNEWGQVGDGVSQYVTDDDLELRPLSEDEVDKLLVLLEQHNALGKLEALAQSERKEAFVKAGRQLLVALHEATLGEPFEKIIHNEFDRIRPLDAQQMYLSICVLNRLGIPVRANIISRIHGIDYASFKERLFAPLERIVRAPWDPVERDHMYQARHPHIAQIVFDEVLRTPETKHAQYMACLQKLNLAYATDKVAFDEMIRSRKLMQMFPDVEMVRKVFQVAQDIGGEVDHICHQRALYEMNRPGGDLRQAGIDLMRALDSAPHNYAIVHTRAEYCLRMAESAKTNLESHKYLSECTQICQQLKAKSRSSFSHSTLLKAGIKELEIALQEGLSTGDREVRQLVSKVEGNLSEALSKFPGDSHILDMESRLATVLENSDRAKAALRRALLEDAGNPNAAVRLSRIHQDQGEFVEAEQILAKALSVHESDRKLHLAFGKLLVRMQVDDHSRIIQHLRRAYAPGDTNYEAQILHGRELFAIGDLDGSRAIFAQMRRTPVPFQTRRRLQYPFVDWYYGSVAAIEATYCYIVRDGAADRIYAHISKIEKEAWQALDVGVRVRFRIGFAMEGPAVVELALVAAV